LSGKNVCLEADVEDDEFDESEGTVREDCVVKKQIASVPFTTHQSSNSTSLSPAESSYVSSCGGTSTEFAYKSQCTDGDRVAPNTTCVEETKVGVEARQSKVLKEKL